jgi:hypothetical protein
MQNSAILSPPQAQVTTAPVSPAPSNTKETLAQFMARHKDISAAAEALANESQDRFEDFQAETLFQIHCLRDNLQKANSLAEVVKLKRQGDELAQFWRVATLFCERALGQCLTDLYPGDIL